MNWIKNEVEHQVAYEMLTGRGSLASGDHVLTPGERVRIQAACCLHLALTRTLAGHTASRAGQRAHEQHAARRPAVRALGRLLQASSPSKLHVASRRKDRPTDLLGSSLISSQRGPRGPRPAADVWVAVPGRQAAWSISTARPAEAAEARRRPADRISD